MKVLNRLLISAMMAALIFVVTWLVHIPIPGTVAAYINSGDAIVYLSAFIPGGAYAAFAAGIGSALADIASGAAVYALPTLIIKFLMAMVCWAVIRKNKNKTWRFLTGAILGGIVMLIGYMVTDTALFGLSISMIGLIGNLIQFAFGVVAATLLYLGVRRLPF